MKHAINGLSIGIKNINNYLDVCPKTDDCDWLKNGLAWGFVAPKGEDGTWVEGEAVLKGDVWPGILPKGDEVACVVWPKRGVLNNEEAVVVVDGDPNTDGAVVAAPNVGPPPNEVLERELNTGAEPKVDVPKDAVVALNVVVAWLKGELAVDWTGVVWLKGDEGVWVDVIVCPKGDVVVATWLNKGAVAPVDTGWPNTAGVLVLLDENFKAPAPNMEEAEVAGVKEPKAEDPKAGADVDAGLNDGLPKEIWEELNIADEVVVTVDVVTGVETVDVIAGAPNKGEGVTDDLVVELETWGVMDEEVTGKDWEDTEETVFGVSLEGDAELVITGEADEDKVGAGGTVLLTEETVNADGTVGRPGFAEVTLDITGAGFFK